MMDTNYIKLARRCFPILLLSFLLLTTAEGVKAQQLQASLSHYSTEDGLASNAITDIQQDYYGYLWIATWNGLSRFDGYNFYNYQTGNASHIPYLHNRVANMTLDLQQNIWMRMYDDRVFVLNRLTDKIEDPLAAIEGHEEYRTAAPLTVTSTGDVLAFYEGIGIYKMRLDRNGIQLQHISTSQYTVTSVAEGYQDDIWVGTDQGVHRIDMSNLSLERKSHFADEHITSLFSNGYNIYVGTQSGKIMSFSYGQEPKVYRNDGLPVSNLHVDSHGLIWFTDTRNGVTRLNPETGNEKHFEQDVPNPEYDGFGGEFYESMGVVWTLMNHGGFGYYNRETDEIEYFHNDPTNPWNLSNTVYAYVILDEGVVWESTIRRGLEKLELLKNTIARVPFIKNSTHNLDNEVRAMYYDKERRKLLIANKNSQLHIIAADSSKVVITKDNQGRSIGRSYGIMKDHLGNYWLCSKDNGIYRISPRGADYDVQLFTSNPDDPYSLSSKAAYAAVEDKQGRIWIATYGGGVNVLTKDKNGKTIILNYKNDIRKHPRKSHLKVRTIACDKNGQVWAGTTDGFLLLTVKNGKVEVETLKNSEEKPDQIIMSNDIVCLAQDQKGNMWVGTNGGGLSHVIGQDSKGCYLFENFGAKDGLPSEEIKSITFDEQGNVWFAADHTLCSYSIEKGIFSSYGNLDGIDETLCSEGGAITLSNGHIIFGTLNGYYVIDRKKLTNNVGSVLKLRITDFYLNHQLQSPRLTSHYDYYVPDAKRVELPTHGSVFSFRFAALNYQLQHRIYYQYKLEGYDTEWQNADKTRTASYAGIPTGTYHFKVKAFLLESPDKFDMKVIEVVVPPYFLLSSKAVWIYMTLGLILSLGLMIWRQRQLKRAYAPSAEEEQEETT